MRPLATVSATFLGLTVAALACSKTTTVAVADDDDAGTHADGSTSEPDSGAVVDLGDAGFAVPACTGSVISTLTNIIRLRVHPDGSLFALSASGVLTKYTVGGTTSTDCTLTANPAFAADTGLHDFDLDAAGELFTIRAPSLNSGLVEKRDSTTGATTGVACNLGGDSNAYWGRLAISPDGTKGAVVSTGTSGANAGSGIYAYTLALGTGCGATAWAPDLPGGSGGSICGSSGIQAQGLRADATNVYLVCSQVLGFPFGSQSEAKVITTGVTPGHLEDLTLDPPVFDAPDSTSQTILRFDSTTGAFMKQIAVRDILGNTISGNSNTASLYRIHAMTDPSGGQRFIAVTSDGANASHIYRIANP